MRALGPELDERFLIDDYRPAHLRTWREGGLDAKFETAREAGLWRFDQRWR